MYIWLSLEEGQRRYWECSLDYYVPCVVQKSVHAQTHLILTRLLEAGIVSTIIPTTVIVIVSALLAWARSRLGNINNLPQGPRWAVAQTQGRQSDPESVLCQPKAQCYQCNVFFPECGKQALFWIPTAPCLMTGKSKSWKHRGTRVYPQPRPLSPFLVVIIQMWTVRRVLLKLTV